MTQDQRSHSTFLFVSVALLLATGCGQTQDPVDGSFEDGLGGETGNLPQDFGSGELESGECISDPRDEVYGIKHQCEGWFFARIGYTYEGDSPWFPIPEPDTVSFGPDDEPYEQAKVMACCGEAEEGKTFYEQPHFAESCLLDFRQQACISLAIGLQKLIDEGEVPALAKPKAIEIQNYLAANITACIAGLGDDIATTSDTLLQSTWYLPAEGPWEPLEDVYVEVIAAVSDVYVPDDGAQTCTSLHENNDQFFGEDALPLVSVYDVQLDEGAGAMVGPVYGDGRVTGSDDFASMMTGCRAPWCSRATFSTDTNGGWAIDEMVLYVNGDLVLTNGTDRITVSNARVELYGQTLGASPIPGSTRYEIGAASGFFVVVGQVEGEWLTLNASNASAIIGEETAGEWALQAFDLEYVDDASEVWTLTVGPSNWL